MASKKKKPAKAAKKSKAPKKAASKKVKKAKASKAAKKKTGKTGLSAEKQVVGGVLLGLVEDYFSHVNVVALKLKKPLKVGDTIRIKGHTTDITQSVDSMQIDHAQIQAASAGDSVGFKINDRARKGDAVYKI